MKQKIRRKVVCVFGKFDEESDFVLEPCEKEKEKDLKEIGDVFWIESSRGELEKKENNLDKAFRLLFDVKIVSNLSKLIYSWAFMFIFTLGIRGLATQGILNSFFEIFIVGAMIILFFYLYDMQASNVQGAYWISVFMQIMWFVLTITHQSNVRWISASWKSAIFVTILVLIYKLRRKK